MARGAILFLFLAAALNAATVLTHSEGRIEVQIDGKPFTTFYYGPDAPKPYLHPLRTANGRVVTRRFPMEDVPSDGKDRHHRGVWLGYKDVNGVDFWENEFAYKNAHAGKVVAKTVEAKGDTIHGVFEWLNPAGELMLEEDRTMKFSGDAETRTMDIEITLRARVKTTFGDSKDGFFGVRLAEALSEKQGGVITNSAGGRGMKETWGKPAAWVDYSGVLNGERVGVTVFEQHSSFGHPTRWHVRDYGLLAANPFGAQAFDAVAQKRAVTLERGQSLHLRYRVVVHGATGT